MTANRALDRAPTCSVRPCRWVRAEAPFVGTGMEPIVARDSGAAIGARRTGVVDQVDATRIVIRATEDVDPGQVGRPTSYRLMKFQRSNQNTCINQRPLVKVGDRIEKGRHHRRWSVDRSRRSGARPQRASVAFMPWNGYNYEDSILLSERIVRDDIFTSNPHRGVEVMARGHQARAGKRITRDIPNVSEEALKKPRRGGPSFMSAPRCSRATSWSARSRRRAKAR